MGAGFALLIKTFVQAGAEYMSLEAHVNGYPDLIDSKIGLTQTQAAAGSMSEIEAQGQILALEQQRLPVLQQIAAEQVLIAAQNTGPDHDKMMQAAIDYKQKVDDIAASLHNVKTAGSELIDQVFTNGRASLTTFFSDVVSGSKSASDAFKDLGTSFENIIAGMVAKLVVYYAMLEITGLLMSSDDGDQGTWASMYNSISASGPFGKGFLGGGYTGSGGHNQVAGVVHRGEYIFDADKTSKYRSLFETIAGGSMSAVTSSRSFATGGYADSAMPGGGPMVEVNVVNGSPLRLPCLRGVSASDAGAGASTADIWRRVLTLTRSRMWLRRRRAAKNVSKSGSAGCISACAWCAGMWAAAIPQRASMPPSILERRIIR